MGMFEGSMRIPFQILNCPSHHLPGMTNMNGHRILYKSSLYRNLAVQSSSVLLQTDESGNPPESKKSSASRTESKKSSASRTALTSSSSSGSLLSQVNTVGIIGGASAVSTLSFLEKLIKWSSEDGEDSLPFIACCDPVLSKELLSLERSSFPYLNSKKVRSQLDPTPVVENLKHKRIFLEESGARCIVMPCHISHAWHGEISKGCSVPFLHVGDCVTKELKKAKLKPLEAGGNLRIGVLAADATLTAGIYQEKLQNQGFEVVLPDKATMEHTVIPSIEALRRKDIEGARNLLRIALQVLLVRAVNKIILASDNMQGLLPRDDPLLKKCIDPMDALARSTIIWAQSTEKVYQSTKMQL